MAEAAMIQEEVNVPEGGIADFIMEDADAQHAQVRRFVPRLD